MKKAMDGICAWGWSIEGRFAVAFFLLFCLLTFAGLLDGLEVKTIDLRFKMRPDAAIRKDIVIVYITDDCLEQLGNWPWSRNLHARLINTLASAGAALCGMDILFTEPSGSDPLADANLIEACRKFGRVVLPTSWFQTKVFDQATSEIRTQIDQAKPFPELASVAVDLGSINVDFQSLNPDGIVRRVFLTFDTGAKVPAGALQQEAPQDLRHPRPYGGIHPIVGIAPKDIRHPPAMDGVVSAKRPDGASFADPWLFGGIHPIVGIAPAPSFPLALARTFLKQPTDMEDGRIHLGSQPIPQGKRPEMSRSENGWSILWQDCFLINYHGGATSGAFTSVNYSDVLSGALDPKIFLDRIVLIGPSAVGLSDLKLTPFGEMPGVLIHANILQNLIHGDFLQQPGLLPHMGMLFFLSALTLGILLMTGPVYGLIWSLVLVLMFNLCAFVLFFKGNVVVEMVGPTMMVVLQSLFTRFWQLISRLKAAYESLQERTVELEKSNSTLDCRVQELLLINEAGSRFPSILDLEPLSQEILGRFRTLWDAQDILLFSFEPENDAFQFLAHLGPSLIDGQAVLNDPDVARCLERMLESRGIIRDPAGRWFSVYMPLFVGSRIWGGLFLKEQNPGAARREGDQFWHTLLGVASMALENAKLYHLATVDSLTKLFVRRYFQLQLDKEIKRAQRYGHSMSLLMTDIDHFKKFNDTYGHQLGDTVLREVAAAVKTSLRDVDIAARYGGEEFVLILPNTDLEGAIIVAERTRQTVAAIVIPNSGVRTENLQVTISIGVASFPQNPVHVPEEMIKMADKALYKAKAEGRNRVCFFPIEPK